MALPTDGLACAALNHVGYPSLWPAAPLPSVESPTIWGTAGVLKTFLGIVNTTGASGFVDSGSVLTTPSTTSTARLIQFLSGGGAGAGYTTFSKVLLKSGSTYESIVDTYITGASPKGLGISAYTYSTSSSIKVTDAQITSIVTNLIASGYLLTQTQLYNPAQLSAGATVPAAGTESLVYLYSLEQRQNVITPAQKATLMALEAKNLRFFGAFLCEYCFYKSRYDLLLTQFFAIYTLAATGTGSSVYTSASATPFILSLGQNTDNTKETYYTNNSPTQQQCLSIIGYHLACLNTRMQDMQRILASVNTYYAGVFTGLQASLNDTSVSGSNARLTATIAALQGSASSANKYLSQADFNKAAMDYNLEKNRYANILLGLYAFLNIAALATVFQLARTS